LARGLDVRRFRALRRRPGERRGADLLVAQRQAEAVAEAQQRLRAHLLLLVGDVLALAGIAHPVALDRLRKDDRGLTRVRDRGRVRRLDLDRIVAAAIELPDLLVAPV